MTSTAAATAAIRRRASITPVGRTGSSTRSAVQDRAFPWHAFRLDVSGELYFDSTYQLTTAWDDNGQCAFSGSGDGTIFYPGKTSIIGGADDISIESIRMKMIREGVEDYEYLKLASAKDAAKAKKIANDLFPHTFDSAQTHQKLEAARDALFAMLDQPSNGSGGAGGANGSGAGGNGMGGAGGSGFKRQPDRSVGGRLRMRRRRREHERRRVGRGLRARDRSAPASPEPLSASARAASAIAGR